PIRGLTPVVPNPLLNNCLIMLVAKGGIEPPTQGFSDAVRGVGTSWRLLFNPKNQVSKLIATLANNGQLRGRV
ncbi:MAG TPA: hypothetical protein VFR71_06725, partial [Methyloceanibacter sp.]|nr:hypothetical protein [Methyloceanibacter sp.]